MKNEIDRSSAEIIANTLLGTNVDQWFTDTNLRRLTVLRDHRDLWMRCYMQAKHERIDRELLSLIEEIYNESRMTDMVHWELLPELPDDLWIVDQMVRRGSLSILAGDPKVGKSTLITSLVSSILTGSTFIDRKCTPVTCLYYSLEEIGAEVKARFQTYLSGGEPLYVREGYVPASQFPRILTKDIEQSGAEFVLIDPLFDIVEVESANDYVPVNRAIKELLYISRHLNVHICAVHHSAKAGGILGAQSLRGGTDLNIYMNLIEKTEDRIVHTENRYGVALDKHYVRLMPDDTLKFEWYVTPPKGNK